MLLLNDITKGYLLIVISGLILWEAQKCEVKRVTKAVVESEV